MILDNQHKLYDLEFNLAEVQVQQQQHVAENECSLDANNVVVGDEERKKEVMACIQREIENLERQKSEIEQEIETKYKSASID
jgi:DNA-binding transcriptional MerR regulator